MCGTHNLKEMVHYLLILKVALNVPRIKIIVKSKINARTCLSSDAIFDIFVTSSNPSTMEPCLRSPFVHNMVCQVAQGAPFVTAFNIHSDV